MTSKKGDGLSDHAKRLVAASTCSNEYNAVEQANRVDSDIDKQTAWSKADFFHQAQVLARRLAGWYIDDRGPIWTLKGVDFLQEVERPFRYRVLLGEHEPKWKFKSPIRLTPISLQGDSSSDPVGQAVTLHPDEYSKDETIWLFRDFFEHLRQMGESEVEKLLRLKVEQLLNSRMNRRAHSDGFGDYIAGHPVDHSLLDEFVEAAKLVAFSADGSPRPGCQSIDLIEDVPERIASKKKTFEQIRERFKACEKQEASLVELRLIERCWMPSPELLGLLHDFSEVEASPGWRLVEQHDKTELSGECRQVSLYVLDLDTSGSNRVTLDRWKSVAELAGNDLGRYSPNIEGSGLIRGVAGWVWWMKKLADKGSLTLPLTSNYVDGELWLSAIQAESDKRPDAKELLEVAERNGMETICTDAITASILCADWLANNNWPFESCDDLSHRELQTEKRAKTTLRQNAGDSRTERVTRPRENIDVKRAAEALPPLDTIERDRRSIEEIEQNTPALNMKSIEWIAARKINQEKLGYPTTTLATYRLASSGGRQLSPYFGIDKDGRRWRRCKGKTEGSTIYYFLTDLKKYQTKVSN